jgi:hypothetical protein
MERDEVPSMEGPFGSAPIVNRPSASFLSRQLQDLLEIGRITNDRITGLTRTQTT